MASNKLAHSITDEATRLRKCPVKDKLDTAKSFTVYSNFAEISDDYLDRPLSWSKTYPHEKNEVLSICIDDPSGKPIAPVLIKIWPEQNLDAARLCASLRELIGSQFLNGWKMAPVAYRFTHCNKSMIFPVSIISVGYGPIYKTIQGPGDGVINPWDRYMGDCRREWLREATPYLLAMSKNKCWYCGTALFFYAKRDEFALYAPEHTASQKRRKFQIDHQHPLSRAGSDDLDNLVACCAFCNASKGRKTLDEYRSYNADKALSGFPGLSEKERNKFRKGYKFWFEQQGTNGE